MEQNEFKQEEIGNAPNNSPKTSGSKFMPFVIGLVLIIVLSGAGVAGYSWMSVKKMSQSPFVLKVADMLHFAIVKVNGKSIAYTAYMNDLGVLNKFYTNPPEGYEKPSDEQISDQVITRLVANQIVQSLADKFGVTVTSADMDTAKADLLKNFENEDAATKELNDRYGWDLPTYMEKVIRPLLLEQNLQKSFETLTSDDIKKFQTEEVQASHILFKVDDPKQDATVKAKAQAVLNRIKAGEDFATLAKEFGSDGTKDQGGDLGWFGRGAMVPEFEDAVFALEPGELSPELVKTQFGYHIVKTVGKRQKNDFVSFMQNELKTADIKFLIPIHNPFEKLLGDDITGGAVEDASSTDEAETVPAEESQP